MEDNKNPTKETRKSDSRDFIFNKPMAIDAACELAHQLLNQIHIAKKEVSLSFNRFCEYAKDNQRLAIIPLCNAEQAIEDLHKEEIERDKEISELKEIVARQAEILEQAESRKTELQLELSNMQIEVDGAIGLCGEYAAKSKEGLCSSLALSIGRLRHQIDCEVAHRKMISDGISAGIAANSRLSESVLQMQGELSRLHSGWRESDKQLKDAKFDLESFTAEANAQIGELKAELEHSIGTSTALAAVAIQKDALIEQLCIALEKAFKYPNTEKILGGSLECLDSDLEFIKKALLAAGRNVK